MKLLTLKSTLLLTSLIIGSPFVTNVAFAQGDGAEISSESSSECHRHHFTESQKELLHTTYNKFHEDNKKSYEDMHKLWHEKKNIMNNKIFDKEAYLVITAKVAKLQEQLEQNRAVAFASIADKFSPEERKWLLHKFQHHKHHHHGWAHEAW